MIIQFIYTETDVPGPFKNEGGFKFKCAVIPQAFSLGETQDAKTVAGAEATLNSALPDFAGYRAPAVGVFTSDAEFAALPKEYVFSHLATGHYAFGRLFTCGVNHGRPGTPFHQGLIFDSESRRSLVSHLNSLPQNFRPRPIDLAFATTWKVARGEDEVNASNIDSSSFPYPNLRSADLSRIHHQVFDDEPDRRIVLGQFAGALYEGTDFYLPTKFQPRFANWISLLTHLIPQQVAWRLCFSSVGLDPVGQSNSFPQLLLGDRPEPALRPEVRVWVDVVEFIFTNSLDTELLEKIDEIVSYFNAPTLNAEDSYRLHPALAITLLSFLLLEDALVSDSEADDLADRALSSLLALGLPPHFESPSAKAQFEGLLSDGDRLFHHASKWEYCLRLLEELPVNSEGEI